MKRYVLPIALIATLFGCKKLHDLTVFDIETSSEIVIPSTVGINLPFTLYTNDVETNSKSTFENNDTRSDLIDEITLTSCDLVITDPSNGNFDFLKSIEIYISADGQPEILLAQRQDIQDGIGNTLSLEVTKKDLTEYLKSDQFDMRTNAVTDQAPTQEIHIEANSIFRVDAKILGL